MVNLLSFHKKLFYCRRVISLAVLMSFLLTSILPCARAQEIFMPPPGTMVGMSKGYVPLAVKGLKIYPDNPFRFDFILDTGNSSLAGEELKKESQLLIKYFLAALTVPDDDQWVNLSPTEKNRIIPEHFGYTDMGRDLLAQDYLLKQLSATLTKPDTELGKRYWEGVWSREASYVKRDAKDQGPRFTNDASRATLSKVWVMPDHAKVYESGTIAFITESHLKVMMEGDLENSLTPPSPLFKKEGERSSVQISPFLIKEGEKSVTQVSPSLVKEGVRGSSEIFRNLILPQIEKEVNEGKNFARLRQVYQSMIMAAWYKKKLKDSLLSKIYVGTNKVAGVDIDDKDAKQKIYDQYLEAFKKGVYDIIQEQYDAKTDETVPRKYFSGGFRGGKAVSSSTEVAETTVNGLNEKVASSKNGDLVAVEASLNLARGSSGALVELKEKLKPYQISWDRVPDSAMKILLNRGISPQQWADVFDPLQLDEDSPQQSRETVIADLVQQELPLVDNIINTDNYQRIIPLLFRLNEYGINQLTQPWGYTNYIGIRVRNKVETLTGLLAQSEHYGHWEDLVAVSKIQGLVAPDYMVLPELDKPTLERTLGPDFQYERDWARLMTIVKGAGKSSRSLFPGSEMVTGFFQRDIGKVLQAFPSQQFPNIWDVLVNIAKREKSQGQKILYIYYSLRDLAPGIRTPEALQAAADQVATFWEAVEDENLGGILFVMDKKSDDDFSVLKYIAYNQESVADHFELYTQIVTLYPNASINLLEKLFKSIVKEGRRKIIVTKRAHPAILANIARKVRKSDAISRHTYSTLREINLTAAQIEEIALDVVRLERAHFDILDYSESLRAFQKAVSKDFVKYFP